jgi:hypothetical protein
LEETMIGPRRLEHDSGDVEPFELFDQGAMALRVVRDTEAFAGGVDRDVESVFRNVDADALCYR